MWFFVKLSDIRKNPQTFPLPETFVAVTQADAVSGRGSISHDNLYQELEMDSPHVDTHRDVSYSNSNIQFHSHNFYEMLCCRSSCGAEYLVGSERYKLQKGDIISVPPGVSHRPLLPEAMAVPYIRDVLWISEEFLDLIQASTPELPRDLLRTPFLFRTAGTKWEYLCDRIHEGVLEAENQRLGWNLLVASNTISILIELLRAGIDSGAKPMKAEKPELLDQVLAYIEQHLAEKITLADTAHHFYVSESTITQSFRRKMDVSFYRCVTQRRLIAAKTLIESGVPLEAVAEQVGFSDYSSFFRAFKQEYGIAPRQYRKLQNL